MVGARFCHACGAARRDSLPPSAGWMNYIDPQTVRKGLLAVRKELALPLPSLIAFVLGVGCVVAALLVGVFNSVDDLAGFQAVQFWRMQWLLAGAAAFLAGILLKNPASPRKK
jgi:hypothetical protein